MSKERKPRRNSVQVQMDIVDAVGSALKKNGFANLSITSVAEEAGVDKTVIYRNFETFEKLLYLYIEKQDFWLQKLKDFGDTKIEDKREFMKLALSDQFNTIYSNKEFQQLLIWGLHDKDAYISTFAYKREILSKGIHRQYKDLMKDFGFNFNFINALFISGVYYIILNKDQLTFCETDINKKEEKEEFLKIINWLVDTIFDKIEKIGEIEKIAIKAHKEGVSNEIIARITGLSIKRIVEIVG